MKSLNRIRPTASMVVACIALFVAMGGVGYAAATIGSAQIKNNTIKSADVKNRSLGTKDLSSKAVKSLKGAKGEAGPAGPAGPQGPAGAAGAPGSALAYAYVNADGSVDESRSKGVTDANVAVSGGIYGFRNLGFEVKSVITTPAMDGPAVTGDNAAYNSLAFLGDCNFVAGADQACVSTNTDADPASEASQFFVLFN
jgi:hypothetical protein